MEEEGDGEDLTPFWVQNNANLRRGDRLRRGVSAVLFSSGLVVVLLLVTALFFMVFVVPSTLSFSANIFKPNSVKKSWDSLNVVLVLVAVIFGFLSRNKNEDHKNPYNYDEYQDSLSKENKPQVSNPSTPTNKWYNYPTNEGQRSNFWYEDSDYQAKLERKNSILRRNSSSYPDLREFSSARFSYGDYQRRFYDDFEVDSSRVSDPGQLHRRHRSLEQVDYLREEPPQTKTVIVDTLVSKSKQGRHLAPPVGSSQELEENVEGGDGSGDTRNGRSRRYMTKDLEAVNLITAVEQPPATEAPPPTPRPEFAENQNRAYETVRRRKERSIRKPERDLEPVRRIAQPAPPPPPPPPPPPRKSSKSDRKRGGTTGSATKDFLNSLYHKKKKKQRQKSVDNFDSLLHEPQTPLSFQLPPPSPSPPPPPPLPPPSVLQNLFSSKKHKRKRTITVTLAPPQPPPPPPPPPPRTAAREPKTKSQPTPSITHKPPKHIKMHNLDKLEETSNSGGESPMNRIPPPPPPPPPAFFKSPTWKFVVQGDYVRINSNNSSRSGSPDPDETDSDITPSAVEGGAATPFHPSPLFCPSPDVNTKAESFITNFRAKLKLEKIHSMKKKEVGLSTLGPGPGPSHNK